MKTIIKLRLFILLLLLTCSLFGQGGTNSVNNCCPDFTLIITKDECVINKDTSSQRTSNSNSSYENPDVKQNEGSYCQNGTYSYTVTPNLTGYNYSWVVSGGTLNSPNNSTVSITWGTGSTGTIDIIIQSVDDPNCISKIHKIVDLRPGPIAMFTTNVSSACTNEMISFTNESIGGATYHWDFGDGSTSQLTGLGSVPVQHSYNASGTYTVTLTVATLMTEEFDKRKDSLKTICPCISVYTKIITINPSAALSITSDCKKMLCPGDKATYCAIGTTSPSWNVVGGTEISRNGNCIEVQWNPPAESTQPTVSFTSSTTGNCGQTASLIVPVLYQGIPISGNTSPCQNSTETYSIVTLPGTFVKWSVSPAGAAILTPSQNNEQVTVKWNQASTTPFTLQVEYYNPITCCEGKSSQDINVKNKFWFSSNETSCVNCDESFNVYNSSATWVITNSTGLTVAGPSTGNVFTYKFLTPGVYEITAKPNPALNFCNPQGESKTITVYPKPVLSGKSGKNQICPGSTEIYSIITDSPGKDIEWSVTPAGSGIIAATGKNKDSCQITFNGTGPWVVEAKQNCTANCTFSTDTIQVFAVPAPGPITGASSACMDETSAYSINNYVPGIDYNWSISPGAAGTVILGQGGQTVNILWHGNSNSPNNCQIKVTNCAGSSTNFDVVVNTSLPLIIMSSSLDCCNTLLTASSGFSNYEWSFNGVIISSSNASTLTVPNSSPGEYKLNATGSNSCRRSAKFLLEPSSSNTKIYSGGPFRYCLNEFINTQFTSHVSGCPGTYQWLLNGMPIFGATSGTYTATTEGIYSMIFSPSGCPPIITNYYNISVGNCGGPGCGLSNLGDIQIHPNGTLCNPPSFTSSITQTAGYDYSSGVTWDFGDGELGYGANTLHFYDSIGVYRVWAGVNVTSGGNSCLIWDTVYVTIPAVADFDITRGNNCEKILTNMSRVINGVGTTNYTWSSSPSGATFSNPNSGITNITGIPGIYNVTLSLTTFNPSCTTIATKEVVITGVGNQTIVPTNGCANEIFNFSTIPIGVNLEYEWDFGDGFLSELPTPSHIYDAAGTYILKLNVTDGEGCKAQYEQEIIVRPQPLSNVSPLISATCPEGSSTLTVTSTPSNSTYQWRKRDDLTLLGTSNTLEVTSFGHYYAITTDAITGCSVNSDTALVLLKQEPKAKILGQSTVCYSSNTAYFDLSSSYCEYIGQSSPPNISFKWNVIASSGVSFGNDVGCLTNVSISNPNSGPYSIELQVTDTNGCVAYDTICIFPVQNPTVYINGGGVCETQSGTRLTTNTSGSELKYLWNTGATDPSIIVFTAGVYSVIVSNPSGCNATATTVIEPLPDISLFPIGCDTLLCPPLCSSSDTLRVPLPLKPPSSMSSYTVKWFDNGTAIGAPYDNSEYLLLRNNPQLNPGYHKLSVRVTGSNGCFVISKDYELFIESCDSCSCEKSMFEKLEYTLNTVRVKKDSDLESDVTQTGRLGNTPKIIPNSNLETGALTTNPNQIGNLSIRNDFTSFKNGEQIKPSDCTPVTFQATFNCVKECSTSNVTGIVTNQAGLLVQNVASMPFTFTPTPGMNDIYTLTLFGSCGSNICDSVKVKIPINCPKEEPCIICPKELNERLEIELFPKSIEVIKVGNNRASRLEIPIKINTGTIPLTQVTVSIERVSLDQINPDCITCDNMPLGWYSLTGKDLETNNGVVLGGNIGFIQDPISSNENYMNPREWDWSSPTPFTLNSGGSNLYLYLPAFAQLSCCPLSGEVCMKFSFRDIDCKVCERVVCFKFGYEDSKWDK